MVMGRLLDALHQDGVHGLPFSMAEAEPVLPLLLSAFLMEPVSFPRLEDGAGEAVQGLIDEGTTRLEGPLGSLFQG